MSQNSWLAKSKQIHQWAYDSQDYPSHKMVKYSKLMNDLYAQLDGQLLSLNEVTHIFRCSQVCIIISLASQC